MLDRESSIRRRRWLVGLLIAMSAVTAWWSVDVAIERGETLRQTHRDWSEMRTKLHHIGRMKRRPATVTAVVMPPDAMGRLVGDAMRRAGIVESSMRSTTPLAAARIGRSDYQAIRTVVVLESITLQQLLSFCDAMEGNDLTVSGLRMTPPGREASSDADDPERWNVELTLTRVRYSPIADTIRRG